MASMSKRAQARAEKELQELLTLPGNSTCADCGARNPSWASWNVGVFLCMRCAALHRKLGTHISKVKSLSMDTWTEDQVENMRKNGNTTANQIYNPRNKKPDIPLDADEVDNAMERFIRKKYQEKSLSDGRPEVPSRDEPTPVQSRSPEASPPPILPAKKKGFWGGLGLRSSSSAYPLSKHDKKHRNGIRADGGRISSDDYSTKPKINARSTSKMEMSESELQSKLAQLRDMGFTDTEKNAAMLRKTRGDLEMVIAALVKQSSREAGVNKAGTGLDTPKTIKPTNGALSAIEKPTPTTPGASNNPFGILDTASTHAEPGLSISAQQLPSATTNPWQTAQQNAGIEQAFSGLHVNPQPLFPHNTGGYATQQDPRLYQTMTQTFSPAQSPGHTNNPFMQQGPLSAHSTGSNPYAAYMQNAPSFAPSTNPFMIGQNASSQPTSPSLSNPFGLPPPPIEQQYNPQPAVVPVQAPSFQNQASSSYGQSLTSPTSGFSNFQQGQPMGQFQQQQQPPQNIYQQQQQQQYQQQQQQPPPQQPQAPMMPQQTGRFDKSSILALYNHPQFAPQQQLAPILEPAETDLQGFNQQPTSQMPSTIYSQQQNPISAPKRAATMPVQPTQQSRNPFLTHNTNSHFNNSFAAVQSQSQSQSQSQTTSQPAFSPLSTQNPYATILQNHTQTQSPTTMSGTVTPSHYSNGISSNNPYATPISTSTSTSASASSSLTYGYSNGGGGGGSGGTSGIRHTSTESMSVNNPNLMDGRHSPDAWGGLSARYVR